MLIRYVGPAGNVSFKKDSVYEANPVKGIFGDDSYSVFDEGDDWYEYGEKFIRQNFVVEAQ